MEVAQNPDQYQNFKAFNQNTIIDYVISLPVLQPILKEVDPAALVAEEIGDGNLNMVFRVSSRTHKNQSVIVKQALPYLRLVGESWPLTLDRARIEAEATMVYSKIIPERVPQLYRYDPDLCLTVMEDLKEHLILRKGLIAGKVYPAIGQHLGRFLAHTLFYTSDFYLTPADKKARVKQFINPELCKITEDLIFDEPYRAGVANNQWNSLIEPQVAQLQSAENRGVKIGVFKLRQSFMMHAEALIHGDLHTGSVMVTESDTRVIDPEFAFYGPMGFDIGAIIANLLLNYCSQPYHLREAKACRTYQAYLKATIYTVWDTFLQEWDNLWAAHIKPEWQSGHEVFKTHLAQETLGFAGCKMVRRVVGLAHVADLESIADLQERAQAETQALQMGQALISNCYQLPHYSDFGKALEQVIALSQV